MYAFQHLPLPANSIRNSWRCSMQFMRPKKCPLSENAVQIFPFSFFALSLSLFIFIRFWEFYGVMIWICSGFRMLKISVSLCKKKQKTEIKALKFVINVCLSIQNLVHQIDFFPHYSNNYCWEHIALILFSYLFLHFSSATYLCRFLHPSPN